MTDDNTGNGEPGDRSVKRTKLSEVFHPKRKMLFHFDYGDDWFFLVTCTAVTAAAGIKPFKKIATTKGTPPVQYPDYEE